MAKKPAKAAAVKVDRSKLTQSPHYDYVPIIDRPKFKLPKEVVLVGELPRTAYGKVVRGELKARYLAAGGE